MKIGRKWLGLLVLSALSCGCISVSVQPPAPKPAQNVQFVSPVGFEKLTIADADAAWQQPDTKQTISFQSACQESFDAPLSGILSTALAGIEQLEVQTQQGMHQSRQALRAQASGQLDGVLVRLNVFVFKKGGCSYILNYVGVLEGFEQHIPIFEAFIQNFEAP